MMGWIHSYNVTDEEWLQHLGRKTSWKQNTWKIKKEKLKDNIKNYLRKVRCEGLGGGVVDEVLKIIFSSQLWY
jgi:hypothetical protein